MQTNTEITITWSWEDIKGLREAWSQEECEAFIQKYQKPIHDRSIEEGWQIIEDLISIEEWEKF